MRSPARLTEFATGTGSGVLVDRTGAGQHRVHLDVDCARSSKHRVGVYANEKTARAAVAGVKACKHCRPTN